MASESSSTKCTDCGHVHLRNTHTCGYASAEESTCECKGPRPASLATPCECGHTRNFHLDGRRMFPCTVGRCDCGNFKVKQEAKPDLRCTCGCLRSQHMGKPRGCQNHAFHAFRCDHSQCGWKPREDAHDFVDEEHCGACAKAWDDQLKGVRMIPRPEPAACEHPNKHCYAASGNREWTRYWSCPDCDAKWETTEVPEEPPKVCTCGHDEACGDPCDYEPRCEGCGHTEGEGCGCPQHEHAYKYVTGGVFKCACGAVALLAEPGTEPPMTPEEEEEGPEDGGLCCVHPEGYEGECPCPPGCACCAAKAPPQPERRPPYAVDYSAGGHPFQVLVPGDAAVLAVDGALIIRHADFPVLGISCITPLRTEAS